MNKQFMAVLGSLTLALSLSACEEPTEPTGEPGGGDTPLEEPGNYPEEVTAE